MPPAASIYAVINGGGSPYELPAICPSAGLRSVVWPHLVVGLRAGCHAAQAPAELDSFRLPHGSVPGHRTRLAEGRKGRLASRRWQRLDIDGQYPRDEPAIR